MIRFANVWSKLQCFTAGHLFRPWYEEERRYFSYRSDKWGKRGRGGSRVGSDVYVKYTCDCCGEETDWMDKKMHKIFISHYCPTWDERGSDSQGHKTRGEA